MILPSLYLHMRYEHSISDAEPLALSLYHSLGGCFWWLLSTCMSILIVFDYINNMVVSGLYSEVKGGYISAYIYDSLLHDSLHISVDPLLLRS